MNDSLISRQAAIESIRECAEVAHSNYEWDMEQGYLNAIECIEEEPSTQPKSEERTEETAQNVPKEDLISRKAAIDAIVDCTVYGNADDLKEAVMQEYAWNKWSGGVLEALGAVEALPPTQQENMKEEDT